jgi:putative heme-binding domain-containing protein
LIHGTDPLLQLEAARTLAGARSAGGLDLLREAAFDTALPSDVRAEAILALSTQPPADAAATLLPLLGDADLAVRVEVVRALQGATSVERVVRALRERLEGVAKHGAGHEPRFTEQLRFALSPAGDAARGAAVGAARPATPAAWRAAVAEGGDPTAGRRMFYSPRVGCAGCHIVYNRGGRLGPDLSRAGATRDRARLIDAILRPSDEFSIDYQAWYVKTRDGDTHLGLQLDLKDRGDIELFTTQSKTVHFPGGEIVAYGASKKSLMPDGLEAGMSVSDVRDLIAYLESLR